MATPARVLTFREDTRAMAHKALDKWLDGIEMEGREPPKLRELSERFMDTRLDLLAACLESVIKKRYAAELKQCEASCECGRVLGRSRFDPKDISTLHGRITLFRPYFYCRVCKKGFHPLDEKLGVSERAHQYDIQEKSTLLAAEIPFGLSEEQFERLTGIKASSHFIHEALNAVGAAATIEQVVPDAEEIARRIEDAKGGSRRRPVLVVSCDGAHAPTRPEGGRKKKRGPGVWREAKGVRLYLLGRGQRIVHVASWHQIGDKEQLSQAVGLIAARIPHDRVRLALVGDGAGWVWDVLGEHFPQGEQVLDYYHCSEHVHSAARAQFGEGTLDAQEWAERILTRLSLGNVGPTIGGLRRMKSSTQAAADELRKLATYLEGQAERLRYRELRRRGLPRGSGGIESANKLICHVRLKRSGAWWLEANGNAMLRIRCAIYNGTFTRVFADYISAQMPTPSPS